MSRHAGRLVLVGALSLVAALPLQACEHDDPGIANARPATTVGTTQPARSGPRADLESARARWRATHLDGYVATFTASSMALNGSWRVHVQEGRLLFAELAPDQRVGLGPHQLFKPWATTGLDPTVEGLFALIDELLAGDSNVVAVSYDASGVPTSVHTTAPGIGDSTAQWTLGSLQSEVLPTPSTGTVTALAALDSARTRWEESWRDAYAFDYVVRCSDGCTGHLKSVTVRGGVTVAVDAHGVADESADDHGPVGARPSVEHLLGAIETVLREGGTATVTYADDGHPVEVVLDAVPSTTEDDRSYSLSNMTIR